MSKKIIYKIPDEVQYIRAHKNITDRTGLAKYLANGALVQEYVSFDREIRKKFLKDRCTALNKNSNWIYFNYAGTGNNSKVSMTFKSGDYVESISTGTSIVFGIHKNHWDKLRTIIIDLNGVDNKDLKKKICELSMSHIYTAVIKLGTNNPVIGHLFYIKKLDEIDITPKLVGLTDNVKYTASRIKAKTLYYIKKKLKNDINNPVYKSIKNVFEKLKGCSLTATNIDLDIRYLASVQSETMEIFSAYLVASQNFSYRVVFPESSTNPLIDYILYLHVNLPESGHYFSVKNEIPKISEQKEIDSYINTNKKLYPSNTNTAKVKTIFSDKDDIDHWKNYMEKNHKNRNNDTKLVYLVWLPAVTLNTNKATDTNGSYPIISIKEIKTNDISIYNNVRNIYTLNTVFDKIIDEISPTNNDIGKSITVVDTENNIKEFYDQLKNIFTYGKKVYIHDNHMENLTNPTDAKITLDLDITYIRYICEKMLEAASKNQINFIDVFKYQILERKKIIYSIATGSIVRGQQDKKILKMSFKFYDYNASHKYTNDDRMSLRSKIAMGNRSQESLGLDIKLDHNNGQISHTNLQRIITFSNK